jgi:hypothetical protein
VQFVTINGHSSDCEDRQPIKDACVTTTLEYVILGHKITRNPNDKTIKLLAYSAGVPSHDTEFYQALVNLSPISVPDEQQSQSIAIVRYSPQTAILARTYYQQGDLDYPVYQYILIPYEILSGIGGRLTPLQTLLNTSIPMYETESSEVVPLKLPTIPTGNLNIRVIHLEGLINNLLSNRFQIALTLLGAIIHERHLLIRNFPLDLQQRIDLVQGLRMLLPSAAAMRMSFTTYSIDLVDNTSVLVFSDDEEDTDRWVFDWNESHVISSVLEHPYIQLLQSQWKNDISDLVTHIKPMDILSLNFVYEDDFGDNLISLTERFQIDQQVRDNEVVETEPMISALEADAPPQGRLRYKYIEKLLQNALNNRDTVAGKRVAQELNRDTNLEASLSGIFDEMLESQPDTVYVFIRNRLNNFGVDERWLPRLKMAATHSLDVAIDDGDIPTLASWLELIAREPRDYGLDEVLKQGILASQPRAQEDGELGIRLILIAARRVPEMLETLYQDDDLMSALPNNVSAALRYNTVESLEFLIEEKPEYFLLAVSHAIHTADTEIITLPTIRQLWALYEADENINLPKMYQPQFLIQLIGSQSSNLMTDSAIDGLLGLIIEANDSELFIANVTHLADRDILFPRLSIQLQTYHQSVDQVLTLLNWVSDIENILPKNIINTYIEMLDYWEWDISTQPMIESLARALFQNSSLTTSSRHLWKLFDTCNTLEIESSSRVAMNRLLQLFMQNDTVEPVVSEIARIQKQAEWSKSLQATFDIWWRSYTQSRTLVQLQRIDRELEEHRSLEPQRQVLKTAIAMRRLLGTRDLVEFADAVHTAYSILESITEAFDKEQLSEIDSETIRDELDAVSDELPADERHILAKNLRELAQYITQMADNRSKPSIMKSDEAIDRQFMQGEGNPQGSIDTMKWIAGYLGGTHNVEEE